MISDNLVKISDGKVKVEDVSYAIPDNFYIDLEMSGQSEGEMYWVSEDKTFFIDISIADAKDDNFIECFTKYFPDEYKKLVDFTSFEYNGLTGVYVVIGLTDTQSFELKAYADKERTKFIDVVVETKSKNICDILKLKIVQDFLHDIRMD